MTDAVKAPLDIRMPVTGLLLAESIHAPGFRMGRERHPFHELYIVRRGHVDLEDERLDFPLHLETGSLWPIPAGTRHRMEDTAESVLLLVCLSEGYVAANPGRLEVWQNLAQRRAPTRPDKVYFEALLDSMNRVLAEQVRPGIGGTLLLAAEVDRVLVQLARGPLVAAHESALDRVRHLAALLEAHFYEPWNIDRAAERVHLSRRRFTTLFREVTGETFNHHLNRLRLAHASLLLRDGRHSIPGAALACGIQDLSHFYRLFKKETGQSPRQWLSEQQHQAR